MDNGKQLDERNAGSLSVELLWHSDIPCFTVEVLDGAREFVLCADNYVNAREMFEHPYAYIAAKAA